MMSAVWRCIVVPADEKGMRVDCAEEAGSMSARGRPVTILLGVAALAAAGCLRNYVIESPNVSVVLAQVDGPEVMGLIGWRQPSRVAYGRAPLMSGQSEHASQLPLKDVVLVANLHFRGLLAPIVGDSLLGDAQWFTYAVKVYENVHR